MVKNIAIVILNWNQPDLTTKTISSFLKINSKNFSYHLYLVDNNSSDNSFQVFQELYKNNSKITLLKTKSNLGYAGGNNYGIKKALAKNYDFILIANNDIIVAPDFIEKLLISAAKNPKSILFPKIYFAPGFEYHRDRYQKSEIGKVIWALGGKIDWNNVYASNVAIDEVDRGQYDHKKFKIDFISGCCLMVPSGAFKEIGFFDDRYFLYLEDVDFSQRAIRAGYKLKLVPGAVIWHLNSASSSPDSHLQNYFISRNRLLFGYKYASLKTKLALFRESIKFLLSKDHWRRLAVRDYYLGRFGKGSWQ
ncbi:MAG: glycosyltransferase family 2 protein [Candidatus Shapirobacteria bacterium]|nr:glycosyltransferase family 2 protein [Candidatus Shapirobacteria bacterium]